MKRNVQKSSDQAFYISMIFALFLAFLVHKEVTLPPGVIPAVAGIGFIILFIASLRTPVPALMVLVCYVPFSKILVGDFGGIVKALNLTNILMIFMLIGMLGRGARQRRLFAPNALNLPIFLFCLLTSISFVRAAFYFGHYWDFWGAFSDVKRWLTPPLIFYLAYNAFGDKESVKRVVKIVMVIVAVVGLMATIDYINVGNVSSLENARIGGIADQPNQLAGFFVYYMFLYVGFFLTYFPALSAWLYIFPLLIAFRGIMVTFSRGGYISFAFGAVATAFFKNKILFIAVILMGVFVFLNPWMLPKGIQYRMSSTFDESAMVSDADFEESLEISARRRVEVWKTAMEMIKERPVWGFGYGTFQSVVAGYNPQLGPIDAHNSYIIIAAEMGIPALLSFILIILIFLKESFWLYRHTKDKFFKATALGMLGGIFGLLMVNMFGSRLNAQEISGYFWILAAVILKMKAIDKEERKGIKAQGHKSAGQGTLPK